MSIKSILYVEDDPNIQMLIRLFLRNEPYEIITADNPEEAQDALLSQSFDIIIVDLTLQKDGDGAELIRTIRKMPGYEAIPIFVFSGFDESHFRKYNIDGLIQRFIRKPAKKNILIDTIRSFHDTTRSQK